MTFIHKFIKMQRYRKKYVPRKSAAKAKYHLRAARYHSSKTRFSRRPIKRRVGGRRRY